MASAMARKTKQAGRSPRTEEDGTPSPSRDPNVDSPSAQAFAAKARDLDALREAVVDAGSVGAGLWLSYLFLFFYLFIAAAAVTHRDFLFENPVKLPFLGVELPLRGFFVLGPLLFLILHAYLLLHFAMLAGKVGVFHSELQAQIRDEDTRTCLRRQMPNDIFVQFLAGPHEVRTGIMGLMLRLIALITLVIFPIALLVFFQLQFLPYHNEPITWWLRIAVLLDILLLWTLWPSIARGQTSWVSWHDFGRPRIIAILLASLVPFLLVFTIATFPGERLHAKLPPLRLVPRLPLSQREWTSLHEMLVAGDVDLIARKPASLWSNRLVLPGIDVTDRASFETENESGTPRETLSLRGRRLEGAVLIDSNLRNVDLTAARLNGANLAGADLREAKLTCASRKMKEEGDEQKLESTECAQLQRAFLGSANLQGTDLSQAELQGANLSFARLQGAILRSAKLHGANLQVANLQLAILSEAELQGARLDNAVLRGAKLHDAKLHGADLSDAKLQGANLDGAELHGADLRYAKLQGADLSGAELHGADLTGVDIWQAMFPHFIKQSPPPVGLPDLRLSPLTADDRKILKIQLEGSAGDGQLLQRLMKDLDRILRDDAPIWADWVSWKDFIEATGKPLPGKLAEYLADMACREPATAENLARRTIPYASEDNSHYAKPLAQALLSSSCVKLTDDTRERLQGLVSAKAMP
jgi:uncharacterized protein YjbI with pentapeptide repeats